MIQNSSQSFMNSHKKMEILLLSTVIRNLEIRERDSGQALVFTAQQCRIPQPYIQFQARCVPVLFPTCVFFLKSQGLF